MTINAGTDIHIAIIGSGFGGLGMAIRLKQSDITDFVVFERAHDVGGVWRDNTYPGCACDVESQLYSFSFAPNPDWTHAFSRQPEIQAYLRQCAERFDILPHLRFGHEVREATWDSSSQRWRIATSLGVYHAQILVIGTGALSDPAIPQLPGLVQFQGAQFHSSRWDHETDLRGKRVAVIGTGASAIQFVPAIQPQVEQLYLFQRTPPWVLPRADRRLTIGERRMFGRFPLVQRLRRGLIYAVRELTLLGFMFPRLISILQKAALQHLEQQVPDPVLRAKLTPNYTIGCKRILISNDYLPALSQPNVEVVTERIREVRPHAIVTSDGHERPVDAIIFGTGFQVTTQPFAQHIRGRDGRTLAEVWQGSPRAHLGTTVADYPNLFFLQGPNTGLGHNSVIYMIESQISHVMRAIQYMQRHGIATIEPRPEAQAAFVRDVDRTMRGTVWVAGGCASWYLDATGRNSTIWPTFTWRFKQRVAPFNPAEYLLNERVIGHTADTSVLSPHP